ARGTVDVVSRVRPRLREIWGGRRRVPLRSRVPDPHRELTRSTVAREWIGPRCVRECQLDPPDRGRSGRLRELACLHAGDAACADPDRHDGEERYEKDAKAFCDLANQDRTSPTDQKRTAARPQ